MNKEEFELKLQQFLNNQVYIMVYRSNYDSARIFNDELIDYIKELQQENKQLNKQLEYLRSGEYYNQLRFERDMLQDLVDKCVVSKEDKKFIDCTHRNTELLEELEEEKRINEENLKIIDRQQEIIQELRADYGTQAQVERDLLQMRIDKALNLANECEEDLLINSNWLKELLDVLKGDSNDK